MRGVCGAVGAFGTKAMCPQVGGRAFCSVCSERSVCVWNMAGMRMSGIIHEQIHVKREEVCKMSCFTLKVKE